MPYKTFVSQQIDRARQRLAAVRLLGFHRDGLRIRTAVRLYKLLVRPLLEFGAQVVPYSPSQIAKIEQFQFSALRKLLGLKFNVKGSTVRLLAGVEPMEARFSILKIQYFHRIRNVSEKRILYRILESDINNIRLLNCFQIEGKVWENLYGGVYKRCVL